MTKNTTASGAADAGLHALADRIEEAQGRAICISVESADYLREALAASAPAAPTQPASKRLIGWRTPDYLEETADAAMAKNWSVHHDLLPIFEGDVHTKLATPQAAPVAPAPQPAPMPYPTDAQVDAVYEQTMGQHLRSQDAPAVRRFGRAMFLCAWNAAAPKADHISDAGQKVAPLQQGEYLPLAVASAPERIWLDLGFDPKETDADFSDLNTPTWSADNASGHGIEYVRADRAARGAAQASPAPASHEALTTALAACRDAFPVPASGSAAEFEWQGAMTDPLGVPAYVRACAAPPAQEARVPLTSQECRDILEEVDHYNFAIDLIRAVEKHHGITAAQQKEAP